MAHRLHQSRYGNIPKLPETAASNRELSESEFRAIMMKYENYRPLWREPGDLRGFISWLWAEAYDVGERDGRERERVLIEREQP